MSTERTRSLISFYEKSANVEPKFVKDINSQPDSSYMASEEADNDRSETWTTFDGNMTSGLEGVSFSKPEFPPSEPTLAPPVTSIDPAPAQPTQSAPPVQNDANPPVASIDPAPAEPSRPVENSTNAPETNSDTPAQTMDGGNSGNGGPNANSIHPVKTIDGTTDNGEIKNPEVKMDPQTASTLPMDERQEAMLGSGKHDSQTVNGSADPNEDIVSSIPSVPITMIRPAFKGNGKLKEAGIPRANIAASAESPNGTTKDNYAANHAHETVLQQHTSFFCTTTPGIIYPWDTYYGFRRLGYMIPLSILAVLIIHANFSYPTLPPSDNWLLHFLPDPRFPVYVSRIHKDKHGSDSESFDNEGRFVPQKFEEIFQKYATGDKQSISKGEVLNYFKGQWNIMDPIGWGGAIFEWLATYIFLWPEDGRMKKEDVRRVFDGSIFWEFERRTKEKEKRQMDKKMRRARAEKSE